MAHARYLLQGIKESALVDEKLEKVDALKNTAEKLGGSLAQLALAWAAHNTNVSTVIMGATSEKQVNNACLCLYACLMHCSACEKNIVVKYRGGVQRCCALQRW